jgi:predicted anti-sigma-YlaC factor YlaD
MSVHRDLPCRDVVELLSDHLDGALAEGDAEQIELHLVICSGCSAYLDDLRQTVRLLGALEPPAAPRPDLDALFARWRAGR